MKTFPQRKSPRLHNYDYSQDGAYFVTICSYQREMLFGEIRNATMFPNAAGTIASETWDAIPKHYPDVELDAFVLMPNHVHGVLCLVGDGKGFKTVLGRVINAYKGAALPKFEKIALVKFTRFGKVVIMTISFGMNAV